MMAVEIRKVETLDTAGDASAMTRRLAICAVTVVAASVYIFMRCLRREMRRIRLFFLG